MANVATAADSRTKPMTPEERKVIIASSLGTVFEWYDFYLYGTLAAIIGKQFFSQFPPATQAIFALLTFAAGFLVRPFGALVFGRLGDLVGRKYTFLLTILIMGLSTFAVGLLPSYDQIGVIAPIILVLLRMAQGLALGGEYGGAVVYVAEHSPRNRRGFYTAWIQTTATLGLLLSLFVIVTLRMNLGEEAFQTTQPILFGLQGGWRIPFLLSIILLIISIYIRLQMHESPLFKKMKEEGTQSKAPLSEAFGTWSNGKIVLIAWALIIATPFFLVFGSLSDRIGRKPVILAGCILAAATYFPLFGALTTAANPTYSNAIETVRAEVSADPATCGSLFDPVGIRTFTTPCDVMRRTMSQQAFRYTQVSAPAGSPAQLIINGGAPIVFTDAPAFTAALGPAMVAAGYPAANDPAKVKVDGFFSALANGQSLKVIAILTVMVIYVTIVYGPIAAALVEFFPTRIRYTAMSLPYHIGNGWFGGLLPATSFAIVASTGDIFAGLWYPVIFALLTVVIGVLFVREKRDVDLAN
jgi:MFS family permease